ncbi:transcriptional regulator [Rhizobium leguminosarum bv. viciae WSM1455]|nr:transcriptional regulator [Rhizobium leguminosarum bv. viciae WSM1455]
MRDIRLQQVVDSAVAENIGSLRFSSIAHERYLLAVSRTNRLAEREEIGIDDLRGEKIIAFNRKNLSYTERYFNEKFEEYDLTRNIAYSCDDTYSLVSLVSAGLGIGFAPEWTEGLPNRAFELKAVRGIDFRIGLGVAWNKEDPTASRDDIVDIARSLARPAGQVRRGSPRVRPKRNGLPGAVGPGFRSLRAALC